MHLNTIKKEHLIHHLECNEDLNTHRSVWKQVAKHKGGRLEWKPAWATPRALKEGKEVGLWPQCILSFWSSSFQHETVSHGNNQQMFYCTVTKALFTFSFPFWNQVTFHILNINTWQNVHLGSWTWPGMDLFTMERCKSSPRHIWLIQFSLDNVASFELSVYNWLKSPTATSVSRVLHLKSHEVYLLTTFSCEPPIF